MDGQPVITYAGDQTSFAATQHLITQLLPREQYEWRRSYGRAARMVRVTARFVPFNVAQLTAAVMSASATASLTALPFLHIFWVDCDVDTYKLRVRDDLSQWLSQLRALNILDWLVVVIVRDDSKVKSKLLRTSVFDKVKGEFAGRYPDRCVQLTAAVGEPMRNDAGSSLASVAAAAAASGEPWPTLLQRIKELLLASYSRQLLRFEEHMRAERECRVDRSWSFNRYFLLQEELATFYDALGLYEDSLLQYDELDALLAQLVVSHTTSPGAGPPPAWLQHYCQPAEHWDGALPMDRAVAARRRAAIREDRACLLDLRSYLLGQQCGLLLRLGQPWEAARRALSVTVASVHELRALDVSSIAGAEVGVGNGTSAAVQQPPAGSLACWSLLTCAGALELCEQFKPTSVAALGDEYHAATAGLWKTVQASLYTLGSLCGLLQATSPTSAQLHLVVQLVAGLRDSADTQATTAPIASASAHRAGGRSDSQAVNVGGGNGGSDSPRGSAAWCARPASTARQRLLSALSSQRSFEEYYLEVIELTMGTFKHIGHPRTAQVLGSQLANFYLQRKAAQKAEALLLASLASYDRERWSLLSAHSQLALAECQALVASGAATGGRSGSGLLATAATHSLAATHLAVAASERLEMAVRQEHMERFVRLVGGGSSSSSNGTCMAAVGSGRTLSDGPAQFLSARGSLHVMSVVLDEQHRRCNLANPAIAVAGCSSCGARSSVSSGDDRTNCCSSGGSRLLTGCGCALSVIVHSRLPAGLLARAVALRLRRHRPTSSAPGAVGRPALPLAATTTQAAASGSGLRLHVELKTSETGDPAYSIVCSNARSLLARRDSKPPSTSAAAAAAAAAAAGRREPLSARASLDSGFLSVPALPIGEPAPPPIAASSSTAAVAATAAASALVLAPASAPSESLSSNYSSSSTLNAAAAASSAATTTFVGAVTFGLEASPDVSRSSRSSSVAGPSAAGAVAVAAASATSEELDWTLQTSEPIELRPGLTAVSVYGTVPATPGTFSPEELLLELSSGATISLHDDSMVRCCSLVTWPARNPSLTVQPAGGNGTLLFGVINRCLVTFNVGDSTRSVGRAALVAGLCTLSCSGGAVVSNVAWQCVNDVALHTSPASVTHDLESTGTPAALQTEIDLWCEPRDFSVARIEASECTLSAHWSLVDGSLSTSASSTVSLRYPFYVSHALYSTASGKFVQLSLSGIVVEDSSRVVVAHGDGSVGVEAAASRSFDILSVDLLNDASTDSDRTVGKATVAARRVVGRSSRDSVTRTEVPHRLSPGDQLHYLWKLERTGADAGADGLGPHSSEPLATGELPTLAQLKLTFRFRSSDVFSHQPSSDDPSNRAPLSCLGSYTFSADCRSPLFEVSKALIPSSDYYLTTKECKMAVTIRCLLPSTRGVLLHRGHCRRRLASGSDETSADCGDTAVQEDAASDQTTTVHYEIGSSEEWAISGDRRGKVTLQSGGDASAAASAELAVLLVPLVSGILRLPHVSLLSAESGGRTASLAIGSAPCEADDVAAALPPDSAEDCLQPAESSHRGRDDSDITPTRSTEPSIASVVASGAAAATVGASCGYVATSVVRRLNEGDVYDRSAALLVRVLAANDDHA